MKKMNNKKAIAIASIALASVCLVGVGFSSWIIQNIDTKTTDDITIGVAGTENQSVTINDLTLTDNSIYLDAENGDNVAPIKHLADDNGLVEDLSLSFSFTIAKEQIANFNGLYYRLVDKSAESSLSTYLNANEALVVMPGAFSSESATGVAYYPLVLDSIISSDGTISNATTYLKATQTNATVASDASGYNIKVNASKNAEEDYAFTVELRLSWGATFGNVNPSRWDEEVSSTLDSNFASAQEVISKLEEIKTNINGKAFMIELSHYPDKVATI